MAVGFIRYFNVSREEFTRANEEKHRFLKEYWDYPMMCVTFELKPVDLIFTFYNELIIEFFLWENSSVPAERSLGRTVR